MKFSELMTAPRIGDSTWTIAVATQLVIWRATYSEAQTLKAPARFNATHTQYLTALAGFDSASRNIARGLDTFDVALINKASSEIKAATAALVGATASIPN